MKRLIFSILTIVVTVKSNGFEVPSDRRTLKVLGSASIEALPNTFRLLVWNIQKATQRENWARDFRVLAAQHEVLAFQEANLDDFSNPLWESLTDFEKVFAVSFIGRGLLDKEKYETGVMTLSRAEVKGQLYQRSRGRELYLFTPKMALITYYKISSTNEFLMVANVHALNFQITNAQFYEQIRDVLGVLRGHAGPILLVGDFNTWNPWRYQFLTREAHKMGLFEAIPREDTRFLQLDHVFYRGLTINSGQLLGEIKSSDHHPMSFELSFQRATDHDVKLP